MSEQIFRAYCKERETSGRLRVEVATQATRIGELEPKLKEAAEFIQKLGPTVDYDIVAEIEEMLRCR